MCSKTGVEQPVVSHALEDLLGIRVDLLTPGDLPQRSREGSTRSASRMSDVDTQSRLENYLSYML